LGDARADTRITPTQDRHLPNVKDISRTVTPPARRGYVHASGDVSVSNQ
jgi:hypothetical protein